MLRAVWNGTVVAEAPRTVLVEGNHYFPPEAVHRQYALDSQATSHCPWKGTAWYYPEPLPAARNIAGYVAFWRGVTVEGEPEPEAAR